MKVYNIMSKLAVVAIGGNSLISDSNSPGVLHQWDAVRETCRHLADLLEDNWRLVLTHGNGPQVGYILRRNELAQELVHTTPLDLIVADTQGSIGYMLQQALKNELYRRGRRQEIVSLVTQVLVKRDDPAFENPTKPIGAFMSEAEAREYEAQGWTVVEDSGRGWRRLVASPKPLRIIEEQTIRMLADADSVVIAAGGGGIPVVHNNDGELRELKGTYAVIDKDRASALLAKRLNADLFVISTGVEQVSLNFNTPQQEDLSKVTVDQLEAYMNEGHFAVGSMRPKVEAVLDFVWQTGNSAVISNPPNLSRAMAEETGTRVVS